MASHYLESRDSVEMILVLIEDDHTVVHQGFSTMFNRYSDIEVIVEESDGVVTLDMA